MKIKILLVNTFERSGGAAIANYRLFQALSNQHMEVKMLYLMGKRSVSGNIQSHTESRWQKWISWIRFSLDRALVFISISSRAYLYRYSTHYFGASINHHPLVREADVIHLHWVNFSFLSLASIAALTKRKPVVWTFHDMWAITGGCHYALNCNQYLQDCHRCFYLSAPFRGWATRQLRDKKQWKKQNLQVVTPSNWLTDLVRESAVFRGFKEVQTIGNTLDIHIFKPLEKESLRRKHHIELDSFIILTGAMDMGDERKGFNLLRKALQLIHDRNIPFKLLVFGKVSNTETFPFECHFLGSIQSEREMADAYNLADIFVLPSLQDNLPNTVLESMACGIPVVSFDSGGVRDMVIQDQTGYLAKNGDVNDLAKGIIQLSNKQVREPLGHAASRYIAAHFNQNKIADQHMDLYKRSLDDFNNNLT